MTPAESRRMAALEDQVNRLSRQAGNARGLGVNTAFGATHYRTTQLGFPAELTSGYDTSTGYSWKRKKLIPGQVEPFINPSIQLTGNKAYSFVGDRALVGGTDGWMEPSPDASGWVFVHRYSQSGSGTTDGGIGCALDTISFDVVTNVDLFACTVTKRRINLTGCNLSVSYSDVPACSPASGTIETCSLAGSLPRVFTMTVGVFDVGTYAALQGSWTLTYTPSLGSCSWLAGSIGSDRWVLVMDAGGVALTGQTAGGQSVRYVTLGAALTCSATTIARDLSDGTGVTTPASLTITPG